ncbi:MAG: DinB family protein [Bacteroidetes bacterium]|nr:DinB family protein [Bacteroidota bacterium]
MKNYFLRLYQYNQWANQRVLNALRQQAAANEKILSLLGHVAVAERLWLHRIKNLPKPDLKLWGCYTLNEISEMFSGIDQEWIDYIDSNEDFSSELKYTNYTGDPFVNTLETIIIHTANHATYHRAQVALLLRQDGLEPVNTDFITFDRIRLGQLKK